MAGMLAGFALGAAKGLGEGMVANGQAMREQAFAEAERQHDVEMENLRSQNDQANTRLGAELDEGVRTRLAELANQYDVDLAEMGHKQALEEIEVRARAEGDLEAANDARDLANAKELDTFETDNNIREDREAGDGMGLAADDVKDVVDTAIAAATTTDSMDNEVVNNQAVADYLEGKGLAAEAEMFRSMPQSYDATVWAEAMDRAGEEAGDRDTSMWRVSGEAKGFGEMTREEWITERARELYAEMQGGSGGGTGGMLTGGAMADEDAEVDDEGAGSGDALDTEEGGSDAPPAPRNRDDREVGKVYLAPDGRLVRWTAEGDWEVVE